MQQLSPYLSVVIPVYNSETTLSKLLMELNDALTPLGTTWELIAVDDSSQDESWRKLLSLRGKFPALKPYRLVRNFGQQNALLCGVRQATGLITITMDDDLQHPPAEIPKLLAKLEEGYDVVYGAPHSEKQASWRLLPALFPKHLQAKMLGLQTASQLSSFRAFHTALRDSFKTYNGASPILDMLLSWGTTRFASVSVNHRTRITGRSNYNAWKLYQTAWLMITEFSLAPLRVVMLLGVCGATAGIAIFLYTVALYVTVGSLPGFPFLASTIALFSSAQLIALGTLGEYLARVHIRVTGKPPYIIQNSSI